MSKPVILHVEDNHDIVEVVALAFENLGLQVELLHSDTVDLAIHIIRERREHNEPLDLILVDMNLPDASGIDLIRRIKTNPSWACLPMIVLSAQIDKATIAEAYALGASCYFPKLMNDKTVFDVVEHLYSCWFQLGRSPDNQPNLASEILGRAISVKAQISDIYMKLAREFSDNEVESGLLLRLALNESNHANLFAFFNLKIEAIPSDVLNALSKYIDAKERNLAIVQHSVKLHKQPELIDTAKWALQLEESFSPDAIALAAGSLFPNAPAATIALQESTLKELDLILELAALHADNAEIRQKRESLEERVDRARHHAAFIASK